MIGLSLKRLRDVFKTPEKGVFMDSDRLRVYYQRSDELVQHHFDQVVQEDLADLASGDATVRDAWSW